MILKLEAKLKLLSEIMSVKLLVIVIIIFVQALF